jgi:hypothetical protein
MQDICKLREEKMDTGALHTDIEDRARESCILEKGHASICANFFFSSNQQKQIFKFLSKSKFLVRKGKETNSIQMLMKYY